MSRFFPSEAAKVRFFRLQDRRLKKKGWIDWFSLKFRPFSCGIDYPTALYSPYPDGFRGFEWPP